MCDFNNNLSNLNLPSLEKRQNNENEFINDQIDVSNYVILIIKFSSSCKPKNKVEKNVQGILTGHLVRLFKLYDSFIFLLLDNRLETAWILTRLINETIFNFYYLVSSKKKELFVKFVKSSLSYEKRLWEEIEKRKKNPPFPIELRMKTNIENVFKENNFTLKEINYKEDKNWKNLNTFELAKKLGLESSYEFSYRGASHAIHGTWHEMEFYHLNRTEEYFEPILTFHSPNPQIITAVTIMTLEATKVYLKNVCDSDPSDIILLIDQLKSWYKNLDQQHENFLRDHPP